MITIYKHRRKISIAVLISIMLIFFLSLNFLIWSGTYTEGDFESTVVQQEAVLQDGIDRFEKTDADAFCYQLLNHILPGIVGTHIFLLFLVLCALILLTASFRPVITLRSLSVRMDN